MSEAKESILIQALRDNAKFAGSKGWDRTEALLYASAEHIADLERRLAEAEGRAETWEYQFGEERRRLHVVEGQLTSARAASSIAATQRDEAHEREQAALARAEQAEKGLVEATEVMTFWRGVADIALSTESTDVLEQERTARLQAEAELERVREAMRFYANRENYDYGASATPDKPINHDRGARAREALTSHPTPTPSGAQCIKQTHPKATPLDCHRCEGGSCADGVERLKEALRLERRSGDRLLAQLQRQAAVVEAARETAAYHAKLYANEQNACTCRICHTLRLTAHDAEGGGQVSETTNRKDSQ